MAACELAGLDQVAEFVVEEGGEDAMLGRGGEEKVRCRYKNNDKTGSPSRRRRGAPDPIKQAQSPDP